MYVDAIREHTPIGPYSVGGVSFGGLLAFEVARQLRAAQEKVALLVLLDAVLPEGLRRNWTGWFAHQYAALQRDGIRSTVRRLRQRVGHQVEAADESNDDRRREALWHALEGPVVRAYFASLPVYDGATLMVRATDHAEFEGFDVAPDLGWGVKLSGPLKIVDAPGDHLGILACGQTAAIVGAELKAQNLRLLRAQATPTSGLTAPCDDA
jgi:thioesterase domain-containing protein